MKTAAAMLRAARTMPFEAAVASTVASTVASAAFSTETDSTAETALAPPAFVVTPVVTQVPRNSETVQLHSSAALNFRQIELDFRDYRVDSLADVFKHL